MLFSANVFCHIHHQQYSHLNPNLHINTCSFTGHFIGKIQQLRCGILIIFCYCLFKSKIRLLQPFLITPCYLRLVHFQIKDNPLFPVWLLFQISFRCTLLIPPLSTSKPNSTGNLFHDSFSVLFSVSAPPLVSSLVSDHECFSALSALERWL